MLAQAIQAWRDSTGFGRAQLVKSYFSAVAGFTEPEAVTQVDVQVRACPHRGRSMFHSTQVCEPPEVYDILPITVPQI